MSMKEALYEAQLAYQADEVPVGAVLVDPRNNTIIARAHNQVEARQNPLAHAEMLVIEQALAGGAQKYLSELDLYVTLEPCPLCASALAAIRIRRIYFGAYDSKSGGVLHGPRIFDASTCHHRPEIYGGIQEQACEALLKKFFQEKRE